MPRSPDFVPVTPRPYTDFANTFVQPKNPDPSGKVTLALTNAEVADLEALVNGSSIRNIEEAACRALQCFSWVVHTRKEYGDELTWRRTWGPPLVIPFDAKFFHVKPYGVTCTEIPPPPDRLLTLTFTMESVAYLTEAMRHVSTDDLNLFYGLARALYTIFVGYVESCGSESHLSFVKTHPVDRRDDLGRPKVEILRTTPMKFNLERVINAYLS